MRSITGTAGSTPRLLALALVAAIVLALAPQPSSGNVAARCSGTVTGSSRVSKQGPYKVGKTEVVELKSKVDGSVIQIGYVRPATPPGYRSPIIAEAGPYFLADLRDADVKTCSTFLLENYVSHGYTLAFIPTRGAGGNDQCADLMGKKERSDLDQAVTWLGTRPWSNGKVGMIGISYDGSTPWAVASKGNPHLKTIVPASGVHNLFDLIYHRGRYDGRWWFFAPGYYYYYGMALNTPLQGRDPDRYAQHAATCDTHVAMQATEESYRTGEYDSHGYWAERNMDPKILQRYRGSVLLVQGLQDWNVDPGHQYPFINRLERRGVYVKHMLGQWAHSWPDGSVGGRSDWADVLLRWWDRYLKGKRRVDTGPRAEVQDADRKWRTAGAWPPQNAGGKTLFFQADGGLGARAGRDTATAMLGPGQRNRFVFASGVGEHYNHLPSDTVCATCATFTRTVKGSALRVAGVPKLDLSLVPRGTSGHVAAWMYRVDKAGAWHLLGWGASDLCFPNGGYTAETVTPGSRINMRLPLQPLDAVVHKGEQLKLVLDQGHADTFPGVPFFPVELRYGARQGALHFDKVTPAKSRFFTPKK